MIKNIIKKIILLSFIINLFVNVSTASNIITIEDWETKNDTIIFLDLVKNAPKARWHNNYVDVPFNSDTPEGAVATLEGVKLEDSKTYGQTLYTHPKWMEFGFMHGEYIVDLPQSEKIWFEARVGFKFGAEQTDGVIFSLTYYDEENNSYVELAKVDAKYDGKLDTLKADLTKFAGKRVKLYLCADAKETANEDWAIWSVAKIYAKSSKKLLQQPPKGNQSVANENVTVDLTSDVTKAKVGQEFSLTLSVVNLITNPDMTVQVILRPPSGMSVTSSEFTSAGIGQYVGVFKVKSGDARAIKIYVMPNEPGRFNIKGTIVYYFSDNKENAKRKEISISIEVVEDNSNQTQTKSKISAPGFELILAIIAFIVVLKAKK